MTACAFPNRRFPGAQGSPKWVFGMSLEHDDKGGNDAGKLEPTRMERSGSSVLSPAPRSVKNNCPLRVCYLLTYTLKLT
jgi:hypothetical protein